MGNTLTGVTIFLEALIPVLLYAVAHMYTLSLFVYLCIFCELTRFAFCMFQYVPRHFFFFFACLFFSQQKYDFHVAFSCFSNTIPFLCLVASVHIYIFLLCIFLLSQ